MNELIMFGGWIFWTAFIVLGLWLIIAVGKNSPGWALVPSLVLIWLFGWGAGGAPWPSFSIPEWIGLVAGYFAIGAVYAFAAWFIVVRRMRSFADEWRAQNPEFDKDKLGFAIWRKFGGNQNSKVSIPPKANEFSKKITGWIAYWPVALLSYLFADFLGNIVFGIYDLLRAALTGVSKRAFEGFDDQ